MTRCRPYTRHAPAISRWSSSARRTNGFINRRYNLFVSVGDLGLIHDFHRRRAVTYRDCSFGTTVRNSPPSVATVDETQVPDGYKQIVATIDKAVGAASEGGLLRTAMAVVAPWIRSMPSCSRFLSR